ncbi:protein commissureless 1 [Teleopsis dalmanni]|uniref:protein commissureless 1 n=1 Tax=Teleopsis dalmanni TaxID=139649 RepID=UPI0018CD971A|nr:protein commissureless 1 [Teleopsis dalmanni]
MSHNVVNYLFDINTNTVTTTATTPDTPLAEFIASSSSILSSEQHHNQITFEIPSHRDLEHINTLHKFNSLLQHIGNVAYDTVTGGPGISSTGEPHNPLVLDAAGHAITNEQISKSAVLNLADFNDASSNFWERWLESTDMHSVISYLWFGVVTALLILSVIFIMFTYYFYRKFRLWKKCNKDIRAHLNNDMYPGGTIVTHTSQIDGNEAAYYQMESPPCYTIATGLPTYDEALHHQHFSFGMKFVYPSLAAVHHHPAITGNGCTNITNWEKEDLTSRRKEKVSKQKFHKLISVDMAPPAYDVGASVALLSTNEKSEAIRISIMSPAEDERLNVSKAVSSTPTSPVTSSTAINVKATIDNNNVDDVNDDEFVGVVVA